MAIVSRTPLGRLGAVAAPALACALACLLCLHAPACAASAVPAGGAPQNRQKPTHSVAQKSPVAKIPAKAPEKIVKRKKPLVLKKAGAGWEFRRQTPRPPAEGWKESLNATLRKTTFAPDAPAGRFLKRSGTAIKEAPSHTEELDALLPKQESKKLMIGNRPISTDFGSEKSDYTPQDTRLNKAASMAPAAPEQKKAGAYADFHPTEDVDLKIGPEYHIGSNALQADQIGKNKEVPGSVGMGMKFKMDF